MEKYNIGEVWWIHFPYSDKDQIKRRPAIVIDDDTIAILAMYVTTKNKKDNPYSIFLDDWREAGLPKESWTRIDRIVKVNEWNMDCKIGELSQHDFIKLFIAWICVDFENAKILSKKNLQELGAI